MSASDIYNEAPLAPAVKTPPLGKKVVKGLGWLTGLSVASRILLSIRVIILARLLSPGDIGLFGMAMLTLAMMDSLTQQGMSAALVQKDGDIRPYLGSAYSVKILRGILMGVLLYLSASYVAGFFHEPRVEPLLKVLSLVPVLSGLSNIGIIYFTRELDFRQTFIMQTGTTLVEIGLSLTCAFVWSSAWALVAGRLGALLFSGAVSFVLTKERFRPEWDWQKIKELRRFGVWVFISSCITFILIRGGDVVLGRLLPVTVLGMYRMAHELSNQPPLIVARMMNTLAFPAYSQLQNEPARLQSAFLRSLLLLATSVFFVVALTAALSPDGVPLLLGKRWEAAAPLMPWLAIWGASRALGAAYSTLFNAMGKPHMTTIYQFIMLIMFVIFVYPMAVRYGANGVAVTVSGIGMVALLTRFPLVARLLKMPALLLFKLTFIPIGAALLGYGAAYATRLALMELPILVRLIACSVTCVGGFALTLLVFDRCGLYPIISTINQVLPARLRMKGV